jgi:hypothetical protein
MTSSRVAGPRVTRHESLFLDRAQSLKNPGGEKLGYQPATPHYLSPARTSPPFTINDSHHQQFGIQQWNVSRLHS